MARVKGYELCECDRCGSKQILIEESVDQANWHQCEHAMETGTVKPFLLCSTCFEEYRQIKENWDKDLNYWLTEKQGGAN